MRIATATSYDASLAQLQKRQQVLTTTQEQMTSGLRVLRVGDDPVAAAAAERARAALARGEAEQRALAASKHAMQLTEAALGDAGDLLQSAREQLLAAGNATYGDSQRATLADALRGLRNDLLAVANRSDATGRRLFGGQGGAGQPLLDTPSGVAYAATTGQQAAATAEPTALSFDGLAAFLQAPDPATPGATISVFDVLDDAIGELETPGRSSTDVAATVAGGLAGVDAALSHVLGWRAVAGQALERIDGIGERLEQAQIDHEIARSDAEDLDLVGALSDFQSQQSGYDAALKTYAMIQRMSLFDHIG